jgi:hypothetical protein
LGWGICHLFPGPFIEPLVLLALGTTLFLVSGRGSPRRAQLPARHPDEAAARPRAVR